MLHLVSSHLVITNRKHFEHILNAKYTTNTTNRGTITNLHTVRDGDTDTIDTEGPLEFKFDCVEGWRKSSLRA